MKIRTLEILNFGPIEKVILNLDGRGLTNIEGVNKDDTSADSNGSGKSTIPDALNWVLFNETARGVSGDDVVSNHSGKDCEVVATIDEGEAVYVVSRWRKKKSKGKTNGLSLLHIKDGVTTDLTQGTDKLTQVEVERVLGCSKEVFTKAVYSGQEALPDLPNMTDKEIKELVEEAAGIEILTRAYELAKKHRTTKERAESDANRNVVEADRRYNDAFANRENLKTKNDAWAGELKERVKAKSAELADQATKTKDALTKRDAVDISALHTQLETLRKSVDAVSIEQVDLRKLAQAVAAAKSTSSVATSVLTNKLTEAKRARTHFDSFDSKVGSPCGECGKSYEEKDIAGAKEIARTKLNATVEEGKTLHKTHTEALAAVAVAQKAHDDYQAGMTDLSDTNAKIRATQDAIRNFEALDSQYIMATHNQERTTGDLAKLKAEANPFVTLLEDANKVCKERADELVDSRAQLEIAQKDHQIANGAVAAFGPTGVRAFVLDTVTPYLNARTAHYLGTMSDGRIEAIWTTLATNSKGELTEKFCIEVEKEGTGGKSFKALSGGEKRKVRLSCALALQDLVASRASKPIDLAIFDEIDDALDEAGLERLMAVLEEKGREKGTVLIISHNSLADWCRNITTVTMEGGRSTITGCLVD